MSPKPFAVCPQPALSLSWRASSRPPHVARLRRRLPTSPPRAAPYRRRQTTLVTPSARDVPSPTAAPRNSAPRMGRRRRVDLTARLARPLRAAASAARVASERRALRCAQGALRRCVASGGRAKKTRTQNMPWMASAAGGRVAGQALAGHNTLLCLLRRRALHIVVLLVLSVARNIAMSCVTLVLWVVCRV